MKREVFAKYLDELLEPEKYRDYCPNGLQVEGQVDINRIITGVTASQALLDIAIARKADTILVHHGYFWKNEDNRVTGIRRQRLKSLLENNINLFAYHLPLDAHPELGNNAQLGLKFGWLTEGRFGDQDIAWFGKPPQASSLETVVRQVSNVLMREPLVIGEMQQEVKRVAWCSGGSQSYFEQAVALGVDVYLAGEISEQSVHLARESGVAYIAAGHHATECAGVQALAAHLKAHFQVDCEFVDIANPV